MVVKKRIFTSFNKENYYFKLGATTSLPIEQSNANLTQYTKQTHMDSKHILHAVLL